MKKLIPFLFLMFVLAMTGCRDKDEDASPSAKAGELILNADGKTITFTPGQIEVTANSSGGSHYFSITAVNKEELVQMYVTDVATPTGDFQLSTDVTITYTPLTQGPYASFMCGNRIGSIKITGYDTKNRVISGSFSGTVCGPTDKTVSGSFNKLKY